MKKQYIVPSLTVVTFKMEQGYANSTPSYQSTGFLDMFTLTMEDGYNANAQENWHEYDNGSGSSNLFGGW